MSVYKNILDNMMWSYSRLTAYEHCPYSWYLRYIEGKDGGGSFYAENGKAMHKVFDELVSGKLDIADAPLRYSDLFDEITITTKKDIMDKTFDACVNYLCDLNGDILSDCVSASEVYITWLVGSHLFQGYIDLIIRNNNGDMIIIDHKSSSPFLKKDGKPYASTKEQFETYKKQMYLYAEAVHQNYGIYPKKLIFHHFKDMGKLTVIDFDESEKDKAVEWAKGVIEKIYKDEEFLPIIKTGFCYRLCNYRDNCEKIEC